MRHAKHADFALRVLMYLRVAPGRRGSTADIATAHRISRNHLGKVVRRYCRIAGVCGARSVFAGALSALCSTAPRSTTSP
jgi:DNA-binding IscR family transcriptional regulator